MSYRPQSSSRAAKHVKNTATSLSEADMRAFLEGPYANDGSEGVPFPSWTRNQIAYYNQWVQHLQPYIPDGFERICARGSSGVYGEIVDAGLIDCRGGIANDPAESAYYINPLEEESEYESEEEVKEEEETKEDDEQLRPLTPPASWTSSQIAAHNRLKREEARRYIKKGKDSRCIPGADGVFGEYVEPGQITCDGRIMTRYTPAVPTTRRRRH
ncbi:MAG: hypothetical protein Sylvanvirus13_11 [Sylvanvirus sp.]|uniref:Uncharacterized protein n=1 Tax=Sylvanvirus sp. TaxID=2487774 RepID=A0A3G5AJJ6_9VIRU|nr:MAG: hypothetical protein Sylvanvirus13_11 [Sylvanvirus sp.]